MADPLIHGGAGTPIEFEAVSLLSISSLALGLALLPLPLLAATHVVDDDRAQCPSAAYATIQAALDAAASGDTVRVCAGVYPESVVVRKPLQILGAKAGSDARLRRLGGSGESVVTAPIPFLLGATGITLDGFTIVVALDDSGTGQGIDLAVSGNSIINNVFDDDLVSGIIPRFAEDAPRTTVIKRNHFYGRFGVADSDSGEASNLLITDNLFRNAGILLSQGGNRQIRIIRNSMIHDPSAPTPCITRPHVLCRPAILINGAADAVVQGNKLRDAFDPAIRLRNVTDVAVTDNMLRDGVGRGIQVLGTNVNTIVNANRIAGFASWGLLLEETTGSRLEGNEVEDSQGGVVILSASSNEVLLNNIEDNDSYGIDVDAVSTNNRIEGNHARGNAILDCRDRSSGSGSFGTANTWTNNEGSRSQPAQLCVDR